MIHVCLKVTDIHKSIRFYESLGFVKWVLEPFRDTGLYAFLGMPGDGPRLELKSLNGAAFDNGFTGYGHIAVTVENLHDVLAAVAEHGVRPVQDPFEVSEVPGATLCFITDPDGYEIELWSPHGPDLPRPQGG